MALLRLSTEEGWLPSYPADLEAILDLPPRQRAILYLVEVEDVPYAEAAEQLGMTVVAARARRGGGDAFLRPRLLQVPGVSFRVRAPWPGMWPSQLE